MVEITPMIAGNWKMNGLKSDQSELLNLMEVVADRPVQCDVLICPPATLIPRFSDLTADSHIHIGGQDCHENGKGAHTGDISGEMLVDAGASYVILGHSERRQDHGETNALISAKAKTALHAGLNIIICVGETEQQRDEGQALSVVREQLLASLPTLISVDNVSQRILIAYEPIWAIGTGRTPSLGDVGEMHDALRETLCDRFGEEGNKIRLLYGGSVKPANAKDLMAASNVNGALVGGASLKSNDFDAILDAYR